LEERRLRVRKDVCRNSQAGVEMARNQAIQMISEMKEFASFSGAEQRYIRRSLDVAARGAQAAVLWARSPVEAARIDAQDKLYRTLLELIRTASPTTSTSMRRRRSSAH
jgi:hypothetical protein